MKNRSIIIFILFGIFNGLIIADFCLYALSPFPERTKYSYFPGSGIIAYIATHEVRRVTE
jgi:hypothetical protein